MTTQTTNKRSAIVQIQERQTLPDGLHQVTIAANDVARTGPEIDLRGLRFDNFLRGGGPVLWIHGNNSENGSFPIGRTRQITTVPHADGVIIRAAFEFLPDDPFAQRVRNAWERDFLRAASISWLPIRSEPTPDGNVRDLESDLLEWSIVPIPADPDALRSTHERMIEHLVGEREIEPPNPPKEPDPVPAETLTEDRIREVVNEILSERLLRTEVPIPTGELDLSGMSEIMQWMETKRGNGDDD